MDSDPAPSSAEKPIRKQVFFDIAIAHIPIGRIIFELWYDKVPKTCENFRCLCTGEKGVSSISGAKLHYKGTLMHRIIKGFMVQGGDFTKFNGTGGESIYGGETGRFEDEDLTGLHDRPGLLSMANAGKDTNGSQFFITCARSPHLDGNHVIFGQVMLGKSVLRCMEREPVIDEKTHRPGLDVKVVDCGELEVSDYIAKSEMEVLNHDKKRRRHSSSSADSDSSSSSDNSSRRHKSRSNRKSKSSKRSKYNETDENGKHHTKTAAEGDETKESDEKAPKEPPQPRVDAKGREVRGRGAVSEHRHASGPKGRERGEIRGRGDFRGRRPEEGRWSKIEDQRDNGYERRPYARDDRRYERYEDDADRRSRNGDYARHDRSRGGSGGSGAERSINFISKSSENAIGSSSPPPNTGQSEPLALPPRTLVSYSNVVSQLPPPPPPTDIGSSSPKQSRTEIKERAGSPEQSHRRSSSPVRGSDSE